jgi:hypothetical protein
VRANTQYAMRTKAIGYRVRVYACNDPFRNNNSFCRCMCKVCGELAGVAFNMLQPIPAGRTMFLQLTQAPPRR